MTRRLELLCGIWAGGLSVLAALLSVLAVSATNRAGSDMAASISERTMVFLGLIILGGLGAACGAYLHAVRMIGAALGLLWLAATLLVALTVAGMFSVGVFLFPGAVLAAIAAIVGSRTQAMRFVGQREQQQTQS